MDSTAPIFSISAVARMLGVPVATLRTWEDRYRLVIPERTPSRHRLYTRQQVEQLAFVKAQIDRGVSAADAHRLLREQAAAPKEAEDGKPGLVLIAESDPYAADFEAHYLKAAGLEAGIVLDFDRAVERLSTRPALVVVELLISGGRGLELCRRINQDPDPPPVLAVSTLDSGRRALDAGAGAFLVKPLDAPQFTSCATRLMRSRPGVAHRSGAM